MNSTQRLLAVLQGRMPDRPPISAYELNGWNSRSWENHQSSYQELMELIRRHTDCIYMTGIGLPNAAAGQWRVTTHKHDDGPQHVTRRTIEAGGRTLTEVTSYSDDVKTTWRREHLAKDLDDLDAYMSLSWQPGQADFAALEASLRDLGQDKGLAMVSLGDPICELAEAFEFGEFMVHAMTETARIERALDQLHERYVESLRRMLAGPVKNVIFRICGPEYATPPYLPPELFHRFVTRYDGVYVGMIKQAGAFARIHCHGRVARVLDEILSMGPDALDPLEPPPDGDIGIAQLKARTAGRGLCLMGGIELKHLEHASGQFIRDLVSQTLHDGMPGGRFVLMPTAAPINIPLAPKTLHNYRAMIETALAFKL